MLPGVAAAGLQGLYVARAGYPDGAGGLVGRVTGLVAAEPVVNADQSLAFFDLRAYRRRLLGSLPPARLRELRRATLRPLRFRRPERKEDLGAAVGHYMLSVPQIELALENPSAGPRAARLEVALRRPSGASGPVTVQGPATAAATVLVGRTLVRRRWDVMLPPGRSVLRISAAEPPPYPQLAVALTDAAFLPFTGASRAS
jgi:hypothetical protein